MNDSSESGALLADIRACTLCAGLPLGPKPILQFAPSAKVLIVGQAPGRKAHERGAPFDDVSGDRLRGWLGVDRETFYNPAIFALVPMGFCFPGTGKGGDLPPRAECAPAWRSDILATLNQVELTLVLGRFAMGWHLDAAKSASLTDIVAGWRSHWPDVMPLPHPSPRNIRWLKKNPWFEQDVLPALADRVAEVLAA